MKPGAARRGDTYVDRSGRVWTVHDKQVRTGDVRLLLGPQDGRTAMWYSFDRDRELDIRRPDTG